MKYIVTGESVFAARNAIDGVLANRSHGSWPYESWGINQRQDAQILLEFGRWVRLENLIQSEDPSPFPALTQIEVYGSDPRLE